MNLSSIEKQNLYPKCYLTNNNIAYKYVTKDIPDSELKIYNFVPTYDKWCLGCPSKNATKKCSKCKSVYFCDKKCQEKCWKVHKKHCKRDLFTICSLCGKDNPKIKCDDCPVPDLMDKKEKSD